MQYSRTDEQQHGWDFRKLLEVREGKMEPFYSLQQFNLWGRQSLEFPNFLAASHNYYKIRSVACLHFPAI